MPDLRREFNPKRSGQRAHEHRKKILNAKDGVKMNL